MDKATRLLEQPGLCVLDHAGRGPALYVSGCVRRVPYGVTVVMYYRTTTSPGVAGPLLIPILPYVQTSIVVSLYV